MMGGMSFHLAQVNIARLLAPLDSEQLAGFVAALGPVNATADEAPGFVWRLKDEAATRRASKAFAWDAAGSVGVIVNMSVWTDMERLTEYVYSPLHREVLRQRRQWFAAVDEPTTACWWVPAGHVPTTDEAEDRVRHIREHGPTRPRVQPQAALPTRGPAHAVTLPATILPMCTHFLSLNVHFDKIAYCRPRGVDVYVLASTTRLIALRMKHAGLRRTGSRRSSRTAQRFTVTTVALLMCWRPPNRTPPSAKSCDGDRDAFRLGWVDAGKTSTVRELQCWIWTPSSEYSS